MTFDSPGALEQGLRDVGYLANERIAMAMFLAERLQKPVLAEGPAGTGKTELAKAMSRLTGHRLIRLQCYEGLDESKVLYEWDYKKQLLRIQAGGAWEDLFGDDYLLSRPLLEAIRSPEPVVLLVDEIDRVELETEALLLEVLSDYQVSIPELGTLRAVQIPLVVLTSNNTRELSEALKRRCLYVHVDYPDIEREVEIIRTRVPDVEERLARRVAEVVAMLRDLDVEKRPSVAETLDWARSLVVRNVTAVDVQETLQSLPLLLKHQSDIELAMTALTPKHST